MSKSFKSFFCSGLTDLAPTSQDSQVIFPWKPLLCSIVIGIFCWNSWWRSVLHRCSNKRKIPSAVTRPVGLPSLRLHVTSQHLGGSWAALSCWVVLGLGEGKMNSDSPSFDSVARGCSVCLWRVLLVRFTKWSLMKTRRMLSDYIVLLAGIPSLLSRITYYLSIFE